MREIPPCPGEGGANTLTLDRGGSLARSGVFAGLSGHPEVPRQPFGESAHGQSARLATHLGRRFRSCQARCARPPRNAAPSLRWRKTRREGIGHEDKSRELAEAPHEAEGSCGGEDPEASEEGRGQIPEKGRRPVSSGGAKKRAENRSEFDPEEAAESPSAFQREGVPTRGGGEEKAQPRAHGVECLEPALLATRAPVLAEGIGGERVFP